VVGSTSDVHSLSEWRFHLSALDSTPRFKRRLHSGHSLMKDRVERTEQVFDFT
jgi:hypothetical protein